MAVTKGTKKEVVDEVDEVEDDESDPREDAKGLIREVVDEALEAWTKKNRPAPRKTDPNKDGQPSWYESLFGKL